MTARNDFDGVFSGWLDDQAGRGAPDYLGEILARTMRTRQRPAWSSLERWLPVQTTLRFAATPRIAWLAAVVALVVVLGAAVLVAGTRTRPLPPPFGPARNGAVIYGGSDKDIYALNPATGAAMLLVSGASRDSAPSLSPDGTRFLFFRDAVTDPATGTKSAQIMVASDDGTNVRPLTGQLENIRDAAWSHDGSLVAVSADRADAPVLELFTVDGKAQPAVIDIGGLTAHYVAFRPGDAELTFRGSMADSDGLYAVGVDGRGLRTIVPPGNGDYGTLSPDGSKVAFQVWDGIAGRIHVVDVATGRDMTPAFEPAAGVDGVIDDNPVWSPDGSRLVFLRYHGSDGYRMAVAPSAGGQVIEIGPLMASNFTRAYAQFSPDGTQVLVHYDADGSTWLLDPSGTAGGTQLSTKIADTSSWQRLAP